MDKEDVLINMVAYLLGHTVHQSLIEGIHKSV